MLVPSCAPPALAEPASRASSYRPGDGFVKARRAAPGRWSCGERQPAIAGAISGGVGVVEVSFAAIVAVAS
jgi:hypothetical protein